MQAARLNAIQSEINMTPMIDVLLVLIIIFMVITPVAPRGLPAAAPRDSAPDVAPSEEAIVVEIREDGRLRLNRSLVDEKALEVQLRRVTPRPVFVRGDGGLEYQAVARVVDLARGAGIDRIGLLSGTRNEELR
jgi:biopolymer transport protein ExbD